MSLHFTHAGLIESNIHAYDEFWSSKFHRQHPVNIYTSRITNEYILHNPRIKLVLLDIHKCQSYENIQIRVVYQLLTPNIHRFLKVYFYEWTSFDHVGYYRKYSYSINYLASLLPTICTISSSTWSFSCIHIGHFVEVCQQRL